MNIDQSQILKSWQRYVELTGCEKSKILVQNIDSSQGVRFKESDLIVSAKDNGIFIEINPIAKELLVKKFTHFDEELEKTVSENLEFTFPILETRDRNKNYYIPLFVVSIPSDFLLNDELHGFPINIDERAQIKPNISILQSVFDIDPDDIDQSKNLLDLVSGITKQKYHSFKEMYTDFKFWASERLITKHENYNKYKFVDFIDGLIFSENNDDYSISKDLEDFAHILKVIESKGNNELAKKYPLLDKYITNHTKNGCLVDNYDVGNQLVYGLFEKKYSLGKGQIESIQANKISDEIPLIAIQGAPGTGKTTLFKSLIAQQIVARALAIIDGQDCSYNMLVVSTAVKAVDNVISDIKSDELTTSLNWLWLHGGAKAKLDTEITERLEPFLSELESGKFNKELYDSTVAELTSIKHQIDQYNTIYIQGLSDLYKQMKALPYYDLSEIFNPDTNPKQIALHKDSLIAYIRNYKNDLPSQLKDKINNLDAFRENAIRPIINSYETNIGTLESQSEEFSDAVEHVNSLYRLYPKHLTIFQFADWMLNKKVRGKFNLSISDFFRLQLIRILYLFSPAKAYLEDACMVIAKYDEEQINIINHELIKCNAALSAINKITKDIKQFDEFENNVASYIEKCPYETWSDALRLNFVKEHRRMFELSLLVLQQQQYLKKETLIPALKCWSMLIKGENSPTFKAHQAMGDEFFKLISLAYPVVATTLTSAFKMSGIRSLLHLNGTKPWNLVLLDEAGMVSAESLVPVLCRSKTAMIVGDPLQLEPIRTLSEASSNYIYNKYFQSADDAYQMVGPGQVTAYHRAAGTITGDVKDIGSGIILDEHRRCQVPIAQLFIDIAKYTGLTVSTFKPSERIQRAFNAIGAHNLMFYHVDGKRTSGKTNLDEVKAIGELLIQLEQAGYDLTVDVGIITPYADQKRLLINTYGKRMDQEKMAKIGTIHQFQGVGFEVIIFSPVIFDRNDSASFLNSQPNMLNVAVSRAKQQFIVVGNYHKLKDSKGPLSLIAERTSSDFYLELGEQSPSYERYHKSFSVEKHIYDAQHIKAFEYYLENCQNSIVIIVPWIRKPHNTPVQKQLELLKIAKARGIDITIYYGYSNIELNQKDDNDESLVKQYIAALGSENVIRLPQGTHEKVLLIDDRILVIGSWNWLSNAYYKWYENQTEGTTNLVIRRESSVISMDRKIISEYKARNLTELDIHPTT